MTRSLKKGPWIDPKLLFPGEGAGRSPERAMGFTDYMRMNQGQMMPSMRAQALGGGMDVTG